MDELLRALSEWLLFFFDPPGYRLADSEVSPSFGDASVTLEGEDLVWRLVRDRSQLFLECRPSDGPTDRWYSTDLLIQLLEGQRVETAELDAETAGWVGRHLTEIEARFRPAALPSTVNELKELKRKRAKDLFG